MTDSNKNTKDINNKFNIIVAISYGNIIGDSSTNSLPWKFLYDLKYFAKLTTSSNKNVVIMGKNTWNSIPEKNRPLKNRLNIIISSTLTVTNNDTMVFNSLQKALDFAYVYTQCNTIDLSSIWVIGGEELFRESINHRDCNTLYVTEIHKYYHGNVKFPEIDTKIYKKDTSYSLSTVNIMDMDMISQEAVNLSFTKYNKHQNIDELRYLSLMKRLIRDGKKTENRTGVDTYRLTGEVLEFDLRNGVIPLLTTKFVSFRIIFEELMWFLRGDTNVNHLIDKNVHIWTANTTRDELDKRGYTDLAEHSLPYGYGFIWRHFGAEYESANTDYTGIGFDQIKYVINELKNNQTSRRIILSAWYPPKVEKMVLPACHVLYIWTVDTDTKELDVMMVQRSGDFFLGNPFNICSTSLLTYMLGYMTGLTPRKFVYCIQDCHIYETHINACKIQLSRDPYSFPKIFINPAREIADIKDFSIDDIKIIGYKNHGKIDAPMAV